MCVSVCMVYVGGDCFSNAYCCHIFFLRKIFNNPHGLFPRAIAPLDRLFQRKFACLWGISYFPSSILHCPCGKKKKKWDYREKWQQRRVKLNSETPGFQRRITHADSIISHKAVAKKLQKAPRIVSSHTHWPTDVYPVTEFSNSSRHSTTPRGLLVGLGGGIGVDFWCHVVVPYVPSFWHSAEPM